MIWLETLIVMGMVLAGWAVMSFTYIGWGLLALRPWRGESIDIEAGLGAFWVGWSLVGIFLLGCHFLFPLTIWVTAIVLAIGASGWVVSRAEIRCSLKRIDLQRIEWLIMLIAAIWLANRAIGPPVAFASGYYSFSVVQWAQAYPVVPGLANLQIEFGHVNTALLHAALIDFGYFDQHSNHLLNPLLLLVIGAEAILFVRRFWRQSHDLKPIDVYRIVLLIVFVHYATEGHIFLITGLGSDLSVALFMTALGVRFFGVVTERGSPGQPDAAGRWQRNLFIVAVMLIAAVTIKISIAPFAIVGLLILAILYWRVRHHETLMPVSTGRLAGLVFLIGSVTGLMWIGRSVLLSGYPIFPMSRGGLPVDWRVPWAMMREFEYWVLLGNRGVTDHSDPWIASWLDQFTSSSLFDGLIPLALACMAGLVTLVGLIWNRAILRKNASVVTSRWILFALPLIVWFIVWWLKAPALRFASAQFWMLASMMIVGSFMVWRVRWPVLSRWGLMTGVIILAMIVVGYRAWNYPLGADGYTGRIYLVGAEGGFPSAPEAEFRIYQTESGLEVARPTGSRLSWWGPLVRSPFILHHYCPNV